MSADQDGSSDRRDPTPTRENRACRGPRVIGKAKAKTFHRKEREGDAARHSEVVDSLRRQCRYAGFLVKLLLGRRNEEQP